MTLITKVLSALLLAATLASGILLHRNRTLSDNLRGERGKAAALEHTLAATRYSLTVYMARARETAARADRTQKELTHAVASHPDWRDGVVPDAVFDSLYHDRHKTPDPAPAAAGALP